MVNPSSVGESVIDLMLFDSQMVVEPRCSVVDIMSWRYLVEEVSREEVLINSPQQDVRREDVVKTHFRWLSDETSPSGTSGL
jgi:hypothetical protein